MNDQRDENQKKIDERDFKISALKEELDSLKEFMNMRTEFEEKLISLEAALAQEKKDRIREVSDMERDKIQATEKLRKDMLYKIKETKASLLALNDE